MIQEKTQRVADLAEQLSEAVMTAAICADEIRAIRTFGPTLTVLPTCGKLGKLRGGMRPGETISKLRWAPAPYLAPAPAPKQGSDTALRRGADPTSPKRGRHLTEGRIVSQRDSRSTSRGCGAYISLMVRPAHPTELARLLGYMCTAFLEACANASLIPILSGARLRFPAYRLPVSGRIAQRRSVDSFASSLTNPVLDPSPGVSPCTSDSRCCSEVECEGQCPTFV